MTAIEPDPSPAPPTRWRMAYEHWRRVETCVSAAAIAAIVLLLLYDVVGREWLAPLRRTAGESPWPLYGGARLAVYAFVLACYSGLGAAAASGSLVRLRLPTLQPPWERRMRRLADAVSALCLGGAAFAGALMVGESMAFALRTPLLHWPLWPLQLALPLGFASTALRLACLAAWPDLGRPPTGGSA